MKQLSIIPEIFIWLAFSVVAGFGYAFSCFEYIGGRAEMSVTDIIVPTLVWLLLAAFCTFLLRMVKKSQCFAHFSRYQSLFLECGVVSLLLISGWVFRFSKYFQGIWPVNLDNEFFQYAQVTQDAAMYMNPHPASRLYVGFLHMVFLFLGNIYEAGAVTQFILLLTGVFFWYLAIRRTFGCGTAMVFTAGAMLLPDSIVATIQYNPMMLLFAVYGLIALVMSCYAQGKVTGVLAFVCELFIGVLTGTAVLMDISGWIFAGIGGLALRKHQKNCEKKSLITPVAGCLGVVLGVKAFSFIQSAVYGMSFRDADNFYSYSSLKLQVPDLNQIQEFFFALGKHPVFIVAIIVIITYWFLKRRQECSWIMLGVLFLFGLQLLGLDTYLQHDFLIYMGLLVLMGVSVQQYMQEAEEAAVAEPVTAALRSGQEKKQAVRFTKQDESEKKQKSRIKKQSNQEQNQAVQEEKRESGDTTELPDLSFFNDIKGRISAELLNIEKAAEASMVSQEEPVVTVVHFEDEPAVTVPEKQQERPVIFIPKSMEIPKRVSKPKVEYAVEVTEEKMHFDLPVEENADYDI